MPQQTLELKIMDDKTLLVQGITLAYFESRLEDNKNKSTETLRKILESVKVPEVIFGAASDAYSIDSLKRLLTTMIENGSSEYNDKSALLQTIRISCGDDDRLYDSFRLGIEVEDSEDRIKKMIVDLRRRINNYFQEKKIEDLMTRVPAQYKFNRDKISNLNQFILSYIEELEKAAGNPNAEDDEAILTSVDFDNMEGIGDLYDKSAGDKTGGFVYRTGKKALNRMLQGGIRPGNCVIINALQHKNKTGFTLDMFREISTYNKPRNKDPKKKPLLLWISFEDKTEKNLRSLYISQQYAEKRETVKIDPSMTKEDFMRGFLPQMRASGFHIKMYRINPTDWTFHAMFNLIMTLEAEGYCLEGLFVDYLAMLPTTGCNKTGPIGTDMRDLFRRVRNFCEARGAFVVTPHQLSTDAKSLIRSDVPEADFVKMIAEKGYTSGSKQLDQEVDIELYIHLFWYKGQCIFTIQRGKHRIETILQDESWKFTMYKFPYLMPLPPDEDTDEDYSFQKLSQLNAQAREEEANEFFDF